MRRRQHAEKKVCINVFSVEFLPSQESTESRDVAVRFNRDVRLISTEQLNNATVATLRVSGRYCFAVSPRNTSQIARFKSSRESKNRRLLQHSLQQKRISRPCRDNLSEFALSLETNSD